MSLSHVAMMKSVSLSFFALCLDGIVVTFGASYTFCKWLEICLSQLTLYYDAEIQMTVTAQMKTILIVNQKLDRLKGTLQPKRSANTLHGYRREYIKIKNK